MKILKLICLCGVFFYCEASGYARTFTNQAGKSMEADVVSVAGDKVKLKRADGKEYELPLSALSEADQAFLKEWKPVVPGDKPDPVPEAPTDPDLKPGGSFNLDFKDLVVDRKDTPASCQVRLSAGYDAAKPASLVVWLGGGDGGNSPSTGFLPEGNFVSAGLPYPKGANNPNQANMVGEYGDIWDYQRTMVDAILKKVPNLAKGLGVISGFSNGAHAIDGMLRVRSKKGEGVADYFKVFVLADGGGSYSASKGGYPSLKGKFAYVCWGEKSPNAGPSQLVAKDFRSRGAEHVASEMKDTGHAFSPAEVEKVKVWMEKTVVPVLFAKP